MGWFGDLFRRRADRPAPPAPSAGDSPHVWRPGELAECITEGDWVSMRTRRPSDGPAKGEVRYVAEVVDARPQFLAFDRWPDSCFNASFFRPVAPRADRAERTDAEFITLLGKIRAPLETIDAMAAGVTAAIATTAFCLVIAPALATLIAQVL